MRSRGIRIFMAVLVCTGPWLLAPVAVASDQADPCRNFRWDMSREVALFAAPPSGRSRAAGATPRAAPRLKVGLLHRLDLVPQEQVVFRVPPVKEKAGPGNHGGLARLRVPADGRYRLALDVPFWVDLMDADVPKIPLAFGGSPGCERPHKVLVYRLEQGREYLLQLSGEPRSSVALTLFPAEP